MSDVFDILNMTEIKEFEPKPKSGVAEKYPFSKLDIGQGFKIPDGKKVSSMRVLASARGKTLGRKFSVSATGYVERVG